ncbi:hypothetical protein GH714_011821 [Hevea brasiliensis]|uniref:C2H2-type domain-containing protein n=1 Tax=Hevea brasiliensis TaxID=3981 RepID=A0A6A6KIJ6_HEVBR|nr:hypothetical protein GH714_011821 [Hevea brasiliensis]
MESLDMAKCLILLSHTLQNNNPRKPFKTHDNDDCHLFECKTCNRRFPSFQALGGHRASHKKPRMTTENKPSRQALGGHMRKHRAAMTQGLGSSHACVVSKLPVLRRSNSSKRVFGLDLNLTPLENDLEYLFGKRAPKVDPFF